MIFRNLMLGQKQSSSCDIPDGYVQDGCILCYDGYTAPSGGVWKDLSGSGNDMIQSSVTTYDEANHCCAFTDTKNYSRRKVMHPLEITVEVIVSMTNYSIIYQSKTADWPYVPKLFFGSFFLLSYLTTSGGYAYVNTPSWVGIDPTEDASHASLYQLWQNDTQSGAWSRRYGDNTWQSGPGTRAADIMPTSSLLKFGDSGKTLRIYALRIYNRCLSQEEMKTNRELDIERFNIA